MTADAIGFQAVQADSESWLLPYLGGVSQILEGLLIQREFIQISLHFGSLIGSGRIKRSERHFTLSCTGS